MGYEIGGGVVALRWSDYLIKSVLDDNRRVLYSMLSGSVIVVQNELIEAVNRAEFSGYDKLSADLKISGYLVDSNLNEKELVVKKLTGRSRNPGSLDIAIAPSMDCNFGCPYCYEERERKAPMDEVTFRNLLRFIDDRVVNLKPKKITLYCYGGEPLLYPDHFIRVRKHIDEKYPDVVQRWGIVTNGSLAKERCLLYTQH
jgi:uncharacterized protein